MELVAPAHRRGSKDEPYESIRWSTIPPRDYAIDPCAIGSLPDPPASYYRSILMRRRSVAPANGFPFRPARAPVSIRHTHTHRVVNTLDHTLPVYGDGVGGSERLTSCPPTTRTVAARVVESDGVLATTVAVAAW